ncbi:12325_t:CDS:2, partial [Gigaspora margarita]
MLSVATNVSITMSELSTSVTLVTAMFNDSKNTLDSSTSVPSITTLIKTPKAHIFPWNLQGLNCYTLGEMVHKFSFCEVRIWLNEKTSNSSINLPVFTARCTNEKWTAGIILNPIECLNIFGHYYDWRFSENNTFSLQLSILDVSNKDSIPGLLNLFHNIAQIQVIKFK